jgi:2-keto-3-deoxy-6-phosphogluconate aldolase
MKKEIFAKYRKVYEQAWMPIFGQDEFDTEVLLEGCRLANLQVIEYTLRRSDASTVIPTLRQRFPDAVIVAGSTIDDENVICQMKTKYPQLMTIAELMPYVDGFVSMLPFSDATLERYSSTHLCIPTAQTGGEALRQVGKGAAFIKVLGPDFSFSKSLHAVPTFGYCPTYITGGVTRERMHEAFAAGNVLCAAGFDVVLKGEDPETITPERVAELLRSFVETAKAARAEVNPKFQSMEKMSDEEFLSVLPNYCSVI